MVSNILVKSIFFHYIQMENISYIDFRHICEYCELITMNFAILFHNGKVKNTFENSKFIYLRTDFFFM